jgi:hypothetical protein
MAMGKGQFYSDQEVCIEVHSEPDNFGRQQFTAMWLDDNEWRGGSGVHGQVFFTDLSEFVSKTKEKGKTVRFVKDGEEVS